MEGYFLLRAGARGSSRDVDSQRIQFEFAEFAANSFAARICCEFGLKFLVLQIWGKFALRISRRRQNDHACAVLSPDEKTWRHGDKLRMQIPRADMSLGSIVQYVSEEWKLTSKNEANIQDGHSRGNHDRRESSELSANSECTRCSAPGRSSSPASSSSHSHASCVGAGNGPWCTCKWAAPTQGSSGQTSATQFKKQPDTSRPGMRRCGSPRDAPPAPNERIFSAPGWCSRQQ